MILGEIDFDKVVTGMRVRSSIGTLGVVTKVWKSPRYKDFDQDGWYVRIHWASGRETDYVHWWMLDKVEVLHDPHA